MTSIDFERWALCGLGRAVLWLGEHDDRPHREFLLDLCSRESALDQQSEGSRAGYVYRLIRRTRDPGLYRDRALAALRETTEAENDAGFRISLGGWFADAGDREFGEALYALARKDLDCWEDVVREIAAVFGVKGLVRVAASRPAGRQIADSGFLAYLLEGPEGEEAARAALAAAREANPALAEMCPDPETERSGREDRIPEGAPFDEVRPHLAEPGRAFRLCLDLRRWGERAPEPELIRAAEDLLARDEGEECAIANGLWIFLLRPFPLDPSRLIRWAERLRPFREMEPWSSTADRVIHDAAVALERVRHPLVRELGLRMVRTGLRIDFAADFLVANYEPGDEGIIQDLAERDFDPDEYHGMVRAVTGAEEMKKSPGAVPTLLALYERGRCSFCREYVLSALEELGGVPDWMREECLHDSNPDIRKWAAGGGWEE